LSSRRSIANFITVTAQSVFMLLLGMATTPAVLRWMGRDAFGAYRILQEWVGYLGLLELGLFGSLLASLAPVVARQDARAQRDLIAAGARAYLYAAGAAIGVGLGLSAALRVLVPVAPSAFADLRYGYLILLASFLFLPLQVLRAKLDASQRTYLVSVAIVLQATVIAALSLMLAHAGFGVRGQAMALVAGAAVYATVIAAMADPADRRAFFSPLTVAPPGEARALLMRLQWPILISNACGRICLMTDNIVTSLVCGTSAVTPFVLTQRLALIAQTQLQGLGVATWAALGSLHTTGKVEAFRARVLELSKITTILSVAAMAPIAAFNRDFVRLWVGIDNYGGDLLTLAGCANGLLLPVLSVWGWLFVATGKVKDTVPLMVAQAVVNLVLSVAFTYKLGIAGPALGTTAAYLLTGVTCMPYLLWSRFQIPSLRLAAACLPAVGLGGVVVGVTMALRGHFGSAMGWVALATAASGCAVFYLAIAIAILMDSSERQVMRERFAKFLPGRAEKAAASE
jgi:O-antigen/teichoic acid export membrane protein